MKILIKHEKVQFVGYSQVIGSFGIVTHVLSGVLSSTRLGVVISAPLAGVATSIETEY